MTHISRQVPGIYIRFPYNNDALYLPKLQNSTCTVSTHAYLAICCEYRATASLKCAVDEISAAGIADQSPLQLSRPCLYDIKRERQTRRSDMTKIRNPNTVPAGTHAMYRFIPRNPQGRPLAAFQPKLSWLACAVPCPTNSCIHTQWYVKLRQSCAPFSRW